MTGPIRQIGGPTCGKARDHRTPCAPDAKRTMPTRAKLLELLERRLDKVAFEPASPRPASPRGNSSGMVTCSGTAGE